MARGDSPPPKICHAAGVEATAARAVEIARASAQVKQQDVRLAPEKPVTAEWTTPHVIDPFSISVEQNIALLLNIDSELRAVAGITLAESNLNFNREEQWFVSSEGTDIHQTKYSAGAGYAAYAFADNEIQKRSYPNSYGGQWQNKGYELIEELKLVENARRIAEEAVALHHAEQCPEGTFDIILDSSQLGLQIHESIGHPIELDRVLGMEANFAGTSFLTLDKLRTLRYGSEMVNVVADARQEHGPGLGTFGFDDEGVPAQCTPIITNGLFTGYLSSRETAHTIGENRSGGTLRAEGWNRLPMIRMTNISLLAGRKAAEPRATDRLHRSRHPDADQPLVVDRRPALQLSIRLRDRLGDQARQARAHGEEPVVFRHHDRVLEFAGRDLLAR